MKRFFWLLSLWPLCSGCSPLYNVARTMLAEPSHYYYDLQDTADLVRYRRMGEQAWREMQAKTGEPTQRKGRDEDFHDGFVTGYSKYLFAGGTGAPPPLPPRRYWQAKNQSPAGDQAAQSWFRGYGAGAAAARESGLREWITVPTSVAPASFGLAFSESTVPFAEQHEGPMPRELPPEREKIHDDKQTP